MSRSIRFAAAAFLWAALGIQAATVTGTVRATAATAGATGDPIAGAQVVLIKGALGAGGVQTRVDSMETNAQGEFTFTKADTGITLLSATKTGYQAGTGFANVLADTGTYTVNITLRPPADTTPGKLQGTVRAGTAQGAPLAGATVVVSRTGGGAGVRDTLTTDAQGHFVIASLAPATYSVRASDTGYQAGTVTATVRAKDSAVADIALLPNNASGSVSGKITKASDGSAVSGAEIVMSIRAVAGGTPRSDTLKSGSDGTYKIDSVPAGQSFTLTVKADGFQSIASAGLTVAYQASRVVDFALLPEVAGDTTHGSVAGIVSDTAHKAVAGAQVILARTGAAAGDSLPPDTVKTDANGRFEFPSVTAKISYRVTVSMTGFRNGTANVTVTVGQTSMANITLLPPVAIRAVSSRSAGMRLYAGSAGRLILEMPASPFPAKVRAYDVRGAALFAGSLSAGETRMDIRWGNGSLGYVVVERGGEFHRLAISPAR
ncbi:MAG: carboxypeptidase regulatory-like domain-containing protein [Fibrobacteres bacterium]|nr:carboxypeptidase regulatory-like domain-containing protein [Fibrobacterota bacterium]